MRIRLDGLSHLSKALQQKTKSITPDLERIVKRHGAALQQKAMRAAPVDTGTLKRSITLDISFTGLTATIAPHTDYASYVEYGTRYMDAQPYMRPSYNAQLPLFKADISKLVK